MTQNEIEYEVRNFTIPEELGRELDKLAEDHYGNNVSQFIRSATKDHARTLEDQDEFEFKRLQREVRQIAEKIDEITENLKENSHSQSSESQSKSTKSEDTSTENITIQRQIQRILLGSPENTFTLQEISDKIDNEPLEIQNAVKLLLEKNHIQKKSNDGQIRYQIRVP